MKRNLALSLALLSSLVATVPADAGGFNLGTPRGALTPRVPIDPSISQKAIRSGIGCPDLQARLSVGRVTRRMEGGWPVADVELVAEVRNIGIADYVSDPSAQRLGLFRNPGWDRSSVLIRDFGNVAAGATVRATYISRGWRASDEFPPDFQAYILRDPDLAIDGNPRNDQCSYANDEMTLTGAEIRRRI